MKTDREQLLELRRFFAEMADKNIQFIEGFFVARFAEFVDRLLARFPYEPGEVIQVSEHIDGPWINRDYLCSHPSNGKGVYCLTNGGLQAAYWPCHRPIPRTRTLEVPEEIIEAAKEILAEGRKCFGAYRPETIKMAEWLAREAGKG